MKKPKIKYETRCAVPKSLEPVECPIDIKFIPKQGTYHILIQEIWFKYAFKNNNWYYLCKYSIKHVYLSGYYLSVWNLIPNLREIEWEALKIVGHDKLNKRWQDILFAKRFNDSCKITRRESLRRKLHNSKLK